MREALLLRRPRRHRGDGRAQPARARLRGHPLGRRRHARPDRVPRAVGARPAADRSAWRATSCSSAARDWGGGRRSATSILLDPLTAERDARAGRGLARGAPPTEPTAAAAAGRRARRRQPAVRRGDGAAPRRGRRRRGGELPDTVQGAARRAPRLARAARAPRSSSRPSVVGRTFWEGSLAAVAEERGRRPRAQRCTPSRRRTSSSRRRRAARRRARVRVQARADPRRRLRDAAQGGARPKHFEVGAFIEERAGDRTEEVVAAARRALRPRRVARPGGRDARGRARRRSSARRCTSSRPRATPPPRSTRTAEAFAPLRGRARARCSHEPPRRSRGSARSRATSRCGWAASTTRSRSGRSASSTTAPQEDLQRVADLHRKIGAGLWHKGERKRGDRALPEGHQPAQGRPAVPRARAPLRGGRLALHAHRRQHARHLRVREGAAAGRAARRDARGEPRARDLRPRLRAHRRHREGAREPRALGRARARLRHGRDDPRAARRSATTSRSRRPTTPARGRAYDEALALAAAGRRPARPGRAARRARPARRLPRRLGRGRRGSTEASAELAEREGLVGKLCLPYALRGLLRWREGDWDEAERLFRARRTSWPSRSAGRRSPSRRCYGLAPDAARPRRPRGRRHRPRPGARRVRAGRPDRPVDPGDVAARDRSWRSPASASRPARRRPRPRTSPTGCTTRSAAPPRWRPRARP